MSRTRHIGNTNDATGHDDPETLRSGFDRGSLRIDSQDNKDMAKIVLALFLIFLGYLQFSPEAGAKEETTTAAANIQR
jgi:hypothetical protein